MHLEWLHKMQFVCRIQKGIRMEQALTQLDVKILFDDFTYHANICNALWSLKLDDNKQIYKSLS